MLTVRARAGALLTLALATACSAPSATPGPATPTPAAPDVVEPGWLRPGALELRFTVRKPRADADRRVIRVHAVLTVAAGGRVTAMRTVQSGGEIIESRTDWAGGPDKTTVSLPGCAADTGPAEAPGDVAGWLALPFGPVSPATAAGWTVRDGTASRPGSLAGTEERAPMTPLARRTVREVERVSGAVVTEVGGITVTHAAAAPALARCGEPWPPVTAVPGPP